MSKYKKENQVQIETKENFNMNLEYLRDISELLRMFMKTFLTDDYETMLKTLTLLELELARLPSLGLAG